MAQLHCLRRLSTGKYLGWLGLLAAFALPASTAQIPAFLPGSSSLSAIHDANGVYTLTPGGYDFGGSMAKINGPAILLSPFAGTGHVLNGTVGVNNWSTKARAGAASVVASNSAKITFPAGMGIDQTDPGSVMTASALRTDFSFTWQATGAFLPVGGAFSIPVGATVPVGGAATFSADIHWDVTVSGSTTTNARAAYATSYSFPAGFTTATSFTAPAAPFSPGILAAGDTLRMYGSLIFTANNDTGPAIIEVLGDSQNPPKYASDDPFYMAWANNPGLQFEAFASMDDNVANVPEPSGLMALAIASVGGLRRRRSRSARTA